MRRVITLVEVRTPLVHQAISFGVVADLHNAPFQDVEAVLQEMDAILILGDLVNRHREGFAHAAEFLKVAPSWAPVFYNIGNHERKFREINDYWPLVMDSDVNVLDNRFVPFHEIVLGGFSSVDHPGGARLRGLFPYRPHPEDEPPFLKEMAMQAGFKLLMCHHPEYYPPFVAGRRIDLTLSGHAHGGQIRLGGQGLYAPGQGILPKLTSGWYDNRHLYVSRGMTNSAHAPRLNNPCELVVLRILPEENEP